METGGTYPWPILAGVARHRSRSAREEDTNTTTGAREAGAPQRYAAALTHTTRDKAGYAESLNRQRQSLKNRGWGGGLV
jgi:hypothetical protein